MQQLHAFLDGSVGSVAWRWRWKGHTTRTLIAFPDYDTLVHNCRHLWLSFLFRYRLSLKTHSERSLTLFPWPARFLRCPGKAATKAIRSFLLLKLIYVDVADPIGAHLTPRTPVDNTVSNNTGLGSSKQRIVVTMM
jgi:hypothetical protein